MELQQNRKRMSKKSISLSILGIIILFSIISMVIVVFIYDGQFPRYDRPDTSITLSLRYEDIETQYPRSLVNFKSGDNNLQGYIYGQDQKLGLVVVAHGLGGGADSYLPQIAYFVDKGWTVFAYDVTGSFDSEGKTTKGYPQALLDINAALTYISTQNQFDNLPILLFGHSWGGYAVANALHYDFEISGVASVSGANSAMEMIMEQGKNMMGGLITIQYPYLWLYQNLLFGETASLNTVDAINKSDVPVIIVHGTEDESVSYEGSSIISNIDKITNPNVKSISISKARQNGHNDIFRSKESLDYIDELNIEYRKLYDLHEQNIPYEIKKEFYSNTDRFLAQDINRELMDDIHKFFIECISRQNP